MKFFRSFMGLVLLILVMLNWQQDRRTNDSEVIQPKYERSTLQGRDYIYYTIQPGDTLSMLERKFRIPDRNAIEELNPGINPEDLPINRQIKIPLQ